MSIFDFFRRKRASVKQPDESKETSTQTSVATTTEAASTQKQTKVSEKESDSMFGEFRQRGRLIQSPEAQEIFDEGVSQINSAYRYALDIGEVETYIIRRISERGKSWLLQKQSGTYSPEELAKLKKTVDSIVAEIRRNT